VDIFHASWDHHSNLNNEPGFNSSMADQPTAALELTHRPHPIQLPTTKSRQLTTEGWMTGGAVTDAVR